MWWQWETITLTRRFLMQKRPEVAQVGAIAFKPNQAAAFLGISPRQLWAHTSPRGPIPCIRIGKCARYSRAALEAVLSATGVPGEQSGFVTPEHQEQFSAGELGAAVRSPEVAEAILQACIRGNIFELIEANRWQDVARVLLNRLRVQRSGLTTEGRGEI